MASVSPAEAGEWLLRMGCAKKALAKALGQGSIQELKYINVLQLDFDNGDIGLELSGNVARKFPKLQNKRLQAHTLRAEDLILASVVYSE
jgi:hypothetical protein